jgi:hypothetical protein
VTIWGIDELTAPPSALDCARKGYELESSRNRPNDFLSRRVGLWTTNEGIAHLKEAQQPADLAGDAYADMCANVRRRCISSIPSNGSNARNSTPAPTPVSSAVTLSM